VAFSHLNVSQSALISRKPGADHLVRTIALALYLSALAVPVTASASEHENRATYGEALRWYFEAAEAGDAQAQFLLALKYETGTDVERDLGKAADWYEKAARQGVLEAQFKFAASLQLGRGRAADLDGAAHWYELAARGGFAPAQYNLAVLLINAASSDEDRIDGLVWLMKARNQDFEPAEIYLARIEALWPAEVIATATVRSTSAPAANGKLDQ